VNVWADERWLDIWREEQLREKEMLVFYDAVNGRITKKALAEKFNLRPVRVGLLVRRHEERLDHERMLAEIERLRANTFTSMAEKLWIELGWLRLELERRRAFRAWGWE
jgi:hypothetical protein